MIKIFLLIIISSGKDTAACHTIGEVWNCYTTGCLGGEWSAGSYGLTWPGGIPINNYYLWGSYFAIGVKENNFPYVTAWDYPLGEWAPCSLIYHGPGISEDDIIMTWHDLITNPRNAAGRRTGLRVIMKALAWSHEPWNDFIGYEIYLIWKKDSCDIQNVGETLDSIYLGIVFDCDVSGADQSDPHIDDMPFYDGYVAHEWDTLGYPYDSIILLPDSFINTPDGIYDQYIVYGDNEWEHTLHGEILILPRNLSFMWDDNNPSTPGNDKGENGASAGYVGLALLYSPTSIGDTTWICPHCGDTCRIPRVWAHHIWDWQNDPTNDSIFYEHLAGRPVRFMYKPQDTFDYRFLLSVGPFKMADKETLKFVFAGAVGQELNGGNDSIYGRDWIRGLRQTIDYALAAYYTGSQISDPVHPSGPDEDIHWKILKISEKNYNKISLNLPTILTPSYSLKTKESLTIEIFNISGRKIKEIKVKDFAFPFKNLKEGTYFLRINNEKKLKRIILIKP
uniref:T9SS type A sorting domain-containing protein n=1 Tax=candidate division WOR-3 bacterium TaxID=2052148 RepID=A0A7V4ABL1_UNCW3